MAATTRKIEATKDDEFHRIFVFFNYYLATAAAAAAAASIVVVYDCIVNGRSCSPHSISSRLHVIVSFCV